ncbi:MAG: dihydrofolate reductase family protein [Anaerolineae bacterium]|nr:dihydrofolate reductase family protein [Anaerolineae bacterium]
MRRIFLFMNISLDGYVEDASHDISMFHNDFEAFSSRESQEVDTLLFGHKTYEMMKFWSTPEGEALQPEIARFMNERQKVVASHQSFDPGWSHVTVLHEEVVAEVRRLKEQPGKTIAMFGSNTLCVSLMQAGLIDEFQIVVNPVVLGEGTSLFKGLPQKADLTMTKTHPFKSGAILLTYEPTAS